MSRQQQKARTRIPAGRFERMARIGWLAGEAALGGIAEGARRMVGGAGDGSVFLTGPNAERVARRLSHLRGAAMKLGQLLSLEGDDLLPPEVADALSVLRSDADAMPRAQVEGVLRDAYGDWQQRFRRFDFDPIASASIGQVHTAETQDGRRLALKIQYPGIARSIDSDVDNLAAALRLARILPGELDLKPVLTEAKAQLRQEADYLAEAEHLRRYGEILADDGEVLIPRVHADLTTREILAMDHLPGRPLEDLLGAEHPQEVRDRVGTLLYRVLFRELFEFRFVQSDPNFANYLFDLDSGRVGLVDLGSACEISDRLSGLYAQLFRQATDGDRHGLRRTAREIGFYDAGERLDRIEGVLDLLTLGCEPFARPGAYAFGESTLPERVRATGLDLAFGKGFLKPPPPGTMFLHRKLGGTFLLCARLGARVNVHALIEPYLRPPQVEQAG